MSYQSYYSRFNAIYQDIESLTFSARVNIASGLGVFIETIESDPIYGLLVRSVKGTFSGADPVLERIEMLTSKEFDHKYENPCDAALSAYAWALNAVDREAGIEAAQLIIDVPHTFWAHQIAIKILAL